MIDKDRRKKSNHEYYLAHQNKIKENARRYRQANKDKIAKRQRQHLCTNKGERQWHKPPKETVDECRRIVAACGATKRI